MVALIGDILDIDQVERGTLKLDAVDFDLRALVSDVVALYQPSAARKGVSLAAEVAEHVPPRLHGAAATGPRTWSATRSSSRTGATCGSPFGEMHAGRLGRPAPRRHRRGHRVADFRNVAPSPVPPLRTGQPGRCEALGRHRPRPCPLPGARVAHGWDAEGREPGRSRLTLRLRRSARAPPQEGEAAPESSPPPSALAGSSPRRSVTHPCPLLTSARPTRASEGSAHPSLWWTTTP